MFICFDLYAQSLIYSSHFKKKGLLALVCLEVQLYGILLKLRNNYIENCSQREDFS